MNIWILTIGTSDVQLESKTHSRSKDRKDNQLSERVWSNWAEDHEEEWDIAFTPTRSFSDETEHYRIPARALGEVYQDSPEPLKEEMQSYFVFPLLDNFLKSFEKNPSPQVIFLVLTDQAALFTDSLQRRNHKCPYWQDTVTLEKIVTHYLQQQLSGAWVEPIVLRPNNTTESLDNWNTVLRMVQEEFRKLSFDGEKIKPEQCDRVYVSHQAGTPAISSAVQFMSLATFRDSVEFLVSHEDSSRGAGQPVFDTVTNSTYLGSLRLQEAKALLKHYDYSGIRDILGLSQGKHFSPDAKELKVLLDAGELWNFAEFHKFKNKLKMSQSVSVDQFPWWQLGYESAYLAMVRLDQENTVDCIFHSFRAIEGLLSAWIQKFHQNCLIDQGKKIQLPKEIKVPWKPYRDTQVNNHGQGLYYAFLGLSSLGEDEIPSDFHTFGQRVFKKRNDMFHGLSGAEGSQAVFEFWEVQSQEPEFLAMRLLHCLNLIGGQSFGSLEEVSVMAKVHRQIEQRLTPDV